jgi:hypothetical protein
MFLLMSLETEASGSDPLKGLTGISDVCKQHDTTAVIADVAERDLIQSRQVCELHLAQRKPRSPCL